MSHDTRVLDFQALVHELLQAVEHKEDTIWSPAAEALVAVTERTALAAGRRHPEPQIGPQLPPGFETATAPARPPAARPRTRRTREPGLLVQIADLAAHVLAADGEPSTRSTPDSKTPPGSRAVELLAGIEAEILTAWAEVTGATVRARRKPRTGTSALRALVGVAGDLDPDDLERLIYDAGRWVSTARVALGWDVPVMALPDVWCPTCEHHGTLRVRADGSSDVWCTGTLLGPPHTAIRTVWPGVRIHAGPLPVDRAQIYRCPQKWTWRRHWRELLDLTLDQQEAS